MTRSEVVAIYRERGYVENDRGELVDLTQALQQRVVVSDKKITTSIRRPGEHAWRYLSSSLLTNLFRDRSKIGVVKSKGWLR